MDVSPEMIAPLDGGRDAAMSIAGVRGIDIGFRDSDELQSELAIRVLVRDLDDVPPGIPEALDDFPVVVMERDPQMEQDLRRFDPVQGGVSVAPGSGVLSSPETLGGIFRDALTGELRGLSCFHVFCIPPFAPGDAAICTVDRQAAATVFEVGAISGAGSAMPGDLVRKRGRSTALTHGTPPRAFVAACRHQC